MSRRVDSLDRSSWPPRRNRSSELEEGPDHRPDPRFLCPSAYAWGRGGQVVKVTHDGGAHWFAAVLPPIRRIVSSRHTLHALLFGNSSEYVSRDYGLTWHLAEPEP